MKKLNFKKKKINLLLESVKILSGLSIPELGRGIGRAGDEPPGIIFSSKKKKKDDHAFLSFKN
jgi:hypothetical protein